MRTTVCHAGATGLGKAAGAWGAGCELGSIGPFSDICNPVSINSGIEYFSLFDVARLQKVSDGINIR
jgi:hypothetical protein